LIGRFAASSLPGRRPFRTPHPLPTTHSSSLPTRATPLLTAFIGGAAIRHAFDHGSRQSHGRRLRQRLYNGTVTYSLSIERAPSPDGTAEGQLTWYDYENKPANYSPGRSDFPSFVAKVLPDRTTRYSYSLRGPHLNVTNVVSTYTAANGSVAVRTNAYNLGCQCR
jgi:hypothetical protein